MAYRLEFEVPGLSSTLNSRLHWRARHRENQKWTTMIALLVSGKKPRTPLSLARLTLTRFSSREPDFDNLVSGFKPITDALVKSGILVDDRMSIIGMPIFRWQKVKQSEGKLSVLVEEVNELT